MSLLTLINRAQSVLNLPITTTVVNNNGEAQKQLLQLANIEGVELADEYDWQALMVETSFTTTATEEQTDSSADLPTDLGHIVDETLYNRTASFRMFGPVASRQWQDQKAFGSAGADSQYRIRGNSFLIMPVPVAAQSVYYEYISNKWCQSSLAVAQAAWAADTDTGRISEHVMTLGLIWRWKQAKGHDYGQDYDTWETAKGRVTSRDGTRRKLSAAGPTPRVIGRGRIAEGSWP